MSRRHQPRQPEAIWVVVADRAHARILTTSQPDHKDLTEIKSLVHAEGAAHARDVLTDRPGRFAGQSGECSTGDPKTDFRHRTATDFACQVAHELESGREHNQFGRLVLFAPALFLGTLRKHLSGPLEKLIAAEVDKELVYAAPTELAEYVRQALSGDASPLD